MEITNSKIVDNSITMTERLELASEIRMCLSLIKGLENENVKRTINELKALLIEYILANMKHDTAELKNIQKKISQVLETFHKNIIKGNDLAEKLKAMEKHPGHNLSNDLAYVHELMEQLKKDMATGDMNNL